MKKFTILFCLFFSLLATIMLLFFNRSHATITFSEENIKIDITKHLHTETINAWYNSSDDTYYFFLPSYMNSLTHISLDGHTRKYPVDNIIQIDNKKIRIYSSSNLSTVYITTESMNNAYLHDNKDNKERAFIKTVNDVGEISFSSELEYITGRGNSTWGFDKKPYTFKLSESHSLCNMSPQKKWVLLANAYEGTKVSYKMMLDMAEYIELSYSPEVCWVDLYLNNEYRGNYLLCQAVDLNSGCIDLSNGVLVEKDQPFYFEAEENGFILNETLTFSIKAPSTITETETSDISDYFSMVDSFIRENNKEYANYLDLDSVITNFLLDEISYKSDTGLTSTFFYKELDQSPLYMGPSWDFDGCFGESGGTWTDYNGSVMDIKEHPTRGPKYLDWYNLLYENDLEYYNNLIYKYEQLLPYLEYLVNEGIDKYASLISDSVKLDMIRYNYRVDTAGYYDSFENNIRYLKFFLAQRINYLNQKWNLKQVNFDTIGNGKTHTVVITTPDNTYSQTVADGDFLSDLPSLPDHTWYFQRNDFEFTEYIPILEDTSIILK